MKDAYLTDEQFEKYVYSVYSGRSDESRERDQEIDSRPRGRCCVFFVAAQHDHDDKKVITFHDGQYWLDAAGRDACNLPIHFCPWCGNYKP